MNNKKKQKVQDKNIKERKMVEILFSCMNKGGSTCMTTCMAKE